MEEIEKLLERNGFTLECQSPFEIRHEETNSFASGIAADMVVEFLKENPDYLIDD